jgi:hypothetical protein
MLSPPAPWHAACEGIRQAGDLRPATV